MSSLLQRTVRPYVPTSAERDRACAADGGTCPNISPLERLISAGAGLGLIALGFSNRRRIHLLPTGIGLAMAYRGLSGNCTLYRALGIDHSAEAQQESAVREARGGVRAQSGVRFDRTININRPLPEVYDFWRDLPRYSRAFDHLVTVTPLENNRTRWIAQGPFGTTYEWEAEVIQEQQNEMFAWRSLPGSDIDTAGAIRFFSLPHDRGTAVRMELKYDPPAGAIGATIASWLGVNVEKELFEGMRRQKHLLEAGEIPSVAGQPKGSCARR